MAIIQPAYGFHPFVFRAPISLVEGFPRPFTRPRPNMGRGARGGSCPAGHPPSVSPHPGMIGSHPRFRHPSISLQFRHPGDENGKGTHGNGRVGKMWSGRERVGTGTDVPSVFRSRPRLPDPFPTLVSVPAVYRPGSRQLAPVPTVSRSAVRCVPEFSRPAVRPVVPIPSRRSRTVFPIPQLTMAAGVPSPFIVGCICSPSYGWIAFGMLYLDELRLCSVWFTLFGGL